MQRQITKKIIESISIPNTRELLLRDTELKGFGVRISPSGTKTFFAEDFYKHWAGFVKHFIGINHILPSELKSRIS